MGQRKARKAKIKTGERTKSCEPRVSLLEAAALEFPCRLLRGGGDEGKDGRKDGREVLWLGGGGRSKEKVRESEEHFEGMDSVAALRDRDAKGFPKRKTRKENRRISSQLRLSPSRLLSAKMEKRPSPIIRCSRSNAQVRR